MSETNFKLPGLEVSIEDNGLGYGNDRTGSDNVLIVGFSNSESTDRVLEPTLIRCSTDFDKSKSIGDYVVGNSLAVGFKQVSTGCSKGIYVVPVPNSCKPTTVEDVDAKVNMVYYLQDLFYTLKDNALFSDIVLKNIYENQYEGIEVVCTTLDYIKDNEIGDDLKDKWLYIVPKDGSETVEVGVGAEDDEEKVYNYSFVKFATDGTVKVYASGLCDGLLYGLDSSAIQEFDGADSKTVENCTQKVSIKKMLADFCQKTTLSSKQILGYMSEAPASSTSLADFTKWVKDLKEQTYNGYLQICATPLAFFNLSGIC